MCLAIPGQIRSIDESSLELRMAKVSFSGIIKDICVQLVPDAKIGDYVLVHVGFAISKIDEKDAEETLKLLKEMGNLEDLEKDGSLPESN